jgi:hypothetical protein
MTGGLGADVVMPSGALVAAIVLGVAEIALAVFCIVDIVRRPAVLGGRKWLWVLLVVLFTLPGSIIYLAVGRVPPPVVETRVEPETATHTRAETAADVLYGRRETEAPDERAPEGP